MVLEISSKFTHERAFTITIDNENFKSEEELEKERILLEDSSELEELLRDDMFEIDSDLVLEWSNDLGDRERALDDLKRSINVGEISDTEPSSLDSIESLLENIGERKFLLSSNMAESEIDRFDFLTESYFDEATLLITFLEIENSDLSSDVNAQTSSKLEVNTQTNSEISSETEPSSGTNSEDSSESQGEDEFEDVS